ncbi:MAG: peptidoglycan DD-metalloendopeptidase family protein [Ruminiclostridium sp.]|nr:peptidoglycan DD-metalloendopeptidase family protein [Ruminiclostridium sp.]
MEYKKAITDTINELKGSFRPADDDELVRAVQERAKKMSNNNENLRKVKFTEITPEYIEPKKSHKTLNVFFGIAGTAAVLAGAVFGLNWLNEHGGLKGPDVQGAGYHDTSETTAYAQPDSTMIPVTVPSDCVYRFNGFTMQPKQFVYDGMSLEFTYDIIYDNGIPDNFENDIALRVFGSNVKVHPQDTTQLLFTNGNTAELMWKHTSLDVLESLEIWIMPGSESAVSADMTEQYKFTVEIPEDSPYLSVDTDKYIGKAETDTAKLTHFDICKNTVGFVVENYPISNPTFEASVNYTDGTSEPLTAEIINVNDMSAENRHYFLYALYGTDINTLKSVTVNGREINIDGSDEIEFENFIGMTKDEARDYLEDKNRNFNFIEMEYDEPAGFIFKQEPPAGTLVSSSVTADLYVSSGTKYDVAIPENTRFVFDGLTVEPRWCTFDGMTLHMAYDVIYDDEPPADVTNDVIVGSEYGLVNDGYELNRSGNRVVMKKAVFYPYVMEYVNIDFVEKNTETSKTFTVYLPQTAPSFVADTNITIPVPETVEKLRLEAVEAVSSGICLLLEGNPEYGDKAGLFDVSVFLKNGTQVKVFTVDPYNIAVSENEFFVGFVAEPFDPQNISEIYVNGNQIYPSADNTSAVTEDDSGYRTGYYEGEEALNILKQYAGEEYCFPLENWKKDVITYRTHDEWTGDTSTDYRFNIPAEEGEPILAVTGGTVIETNSRNVPGQGEGIYITIQAADGRKWRYSHLSDYYVSEGDTVKAGDKIAAVGATGWCTGPLVCISFPDSEVIDPAEDIKNISE